MKKIMCFMFCVLVANSAWSQTELHVASGGTLYVSSKSHVYVTNGMEIISTGNLTVNSDATDSGSLIVKGDSSGDITYQRYIKDDKWHFVAAPVTDQSINDFVTDPSNGIPTSGTGNYGVSFYKNDNPKGTRWQYYTPAAGPLAAATAGDFVNGKGYSNLRNAAGNYVFKGNMATSGTSVNIVIPAFPFAGGATATSHLWSVVGNPYPSFLDAQALLTANSSNLDPSFAYLNVWDGSAYRQVNFASDSEYIAPGQAFMVDPNANNITFTFSESLQTEQKDATAVFYRSSPTPKVVVNLSDGATIKKTTLKYFNNTTTGLDVGWDAGTYKDKDPSFAIDTHLVSNSQGINFTLQCLSASDFETAIVPISVTAAANKTISFSAETTNLPTGIKVFLEDKVSNTITDISTNSYSITTNEALVGIGRFYLHTTESVLNVEDNALTNSLNLYKTNNNSTIRITGLQDQGNATIKIYSITGKQVLINQFVAQRIKDIAIPANLATGVYIVNVISDKSEFTKKLIIE